MRTPGMVVVLFDWVPWLVEDWRLLFWPRVKPPGRRLEPNREEDD